MKKLHLLLVFVTLALFTGCRTSKGFDVKIKEGPDVKSMVYGAVNDRVPFLQQHGFPNVKKPSGTFSVYGTPSVKRPNRLRNGQQQGFLRDNIYAEANAFLMRYGIPLADPTVLHELTHTLLNRFKYLAESAAHDRRAFPDGGPYVLDVNGERYYPHCGHIITEAAAKDLQAMQHTAEYEFLTTPSIVLELIEE
jgi:hypothetical protein